MKKLLLSIRQELSDYKETPLQFGSLLITLISPFCSFVLLLLGDITIQRIFLVIFLFIILSMSIIIRKLRNKATILDGLFIKNVPMVSTISYLKNAASRKLIDYNTLRIEEATISYFFENCEINTEKTAIKQKVVWNFSGKNTSKKTVSRFIMLISKSVFTSYDQINLFVVDKKTGDSLFFSRGDIIGSQQYLTIDFDGDGIVPNQAFELEISLNWDEDAAFKEVEFFIVDPCNYSLNVENVTVYIQSNVEELDNSHIQLLSVDRNNFNRLLLKNAALKISDSNTPQINFTFTPQKLKLYLIKIDSSEAKNAVRTMITT